MLGAGGMGEVYEAEHLALQRKVALKVLHPHFTHNPNTLARFKREAQAAASIGHPGIVDTFDLDEDEETGETFIAMELFQGEELAARIEREGPMSPEVVARLGLEIADAVSAAHEHGIVHRDLKPQNIFLVTRERKRDLIKVLDFGLAKLVDPGEIGGGLTRSSDFLGTPLFMAPEQFHNVKDVDGRADVYSIGVILFLALSGKLPYEAESIADLILKINMDPPLSLASLRPDVSLDLVSIVKRAMAKNRDDRFLSACELADALEAFLEGRPQQPWSGSLVEGATGAPGEPDGAQQGAKVATVATFNSSTWNSGSSESPAARSFRIALLIAAMVLVGGIVVSVGVWLTFIRGGASSNPVATEGVSHDAASKPAAVREEPAVVTPDEVQSVTPPRRSVRFVTHPASAQISLADEPLCQTPCDAELVEGRLLLRASLAGYQTVERQVDAPFPELIELHLERDTLRSGPRARPQTSPRPEQSTKAPPPLIR